MKTAYLIKFKKWNLTLAHLPGYTLKSLLRAQHSCRFEGASIVFPPQVAWPIAIQLIYSYHPVPLEALISHVIRMFRRDISRTKKVNNMCHY